MMTREALAYIRQTLEFEAILYFEVHLPSPAAVAEVAQELLHEACHVEAFPSEGLLKISRKLDYQHNPHED